jgi:hypothetical protein
MEVLDEPLYANFVRVTGLDRPYREELLSKMVCWWSTYVLYSDSEIFVHWTMHPFALVRFGYIEEKSLTSMSDIKTRIYMELKEKENDI